MRSHIISVVSKLVLMMLVDFDTVDYKGTISFQFEYLLYIRENKLILK